MPDSIGGAFLPSSSYRATGEWTFTGPVTFTGTVTGAGVATGLITTSGLTQPTAKLLGRSTAGTGAIEAISIGANLTLAGGSLSASGGGGTSYLHVASPLVLTNAQIKTLPTVSTLLLARATNMVFLPTQLVWQWHLVAGYTNLGDDLVNGLLERATSLLLDDQVEQLSAGDGLNLFGSTGIQGSTDFLVTETAFRGNANNYANASDTDVVVWIDSKTSAVSPGAFTGGNAANTLTLTLAYMKFNLTTGAFVAA